MAAPPLAETPPLKPHQPVELDVEVWPTSIVIPAGYRFALNVRGKDYEYDGSYVTLPFAPTRKFYGVGPFTHTDPARREERPRPRRNRLRGPRPAHGRRGSGAHP